MRVLHIYSGNLFGGIETMLVTIARHQGVVPGMEQHFALCFQARLSEELLAAGATVYCLGEVRTSRPVSVWRARRRLRTLLDRERYDAVICHSPWSQAIFGPEVRQARSPSLVFWLHGEANGRHWIERWASQTAPDLAVCNSSFTAATLHLLYPGVCSEIIYCPVSQPERFFTPAECLAVRAELETPADAVVIIQVSRLEEWKGHALLLDALTLLRDEPGWIYWQVGGAQRFHEQRYRQRLEQQVAGAKIGARVRFLGERSEVPLLLATSDIFCQPNTSPEPFGMAFIESFYAGRPVVTTAMGGGAEIVDSTSGVLIPRADSRLLADALRDLIRDEKLRSRLGDAGPSRANNLCGPVKQIRKLASVLEQSCRGKEAA